jgi:peroxin-19
MLEEFSAAKIDTKKPEEPAAPPPNPAAASAEEEPVFDDDFAKQLQAGMAELLGDLENSVCEPSNPQPPSLLTIR